MVNYLAAPETPGNISRLGRQLGANGGANGDFATLESLIPLSHETAERLDEYLSDQLIGFLSQQLPELSNILDIEALVTNRINAFDVREVEQLVLSISGRHLRWINWFGAGLGAIIGLIQLALNPPW